ncbi:hypothetical protein GCM10020358_83310 [Amorphoplanes nipponensis]|uniref:hypothetical protein n=1 Tax=Actinoplanes nipponensis TaxID=135950 RepID=UPI0031EC4FFC
MLTGEPRPSAEELTAELGQVTIADVHEVAVEALDAALLMVPDGRHADWAGFTEAPTGSGEAMTGRTHRCLDGVDVQLVAGPEGVGLIGAHQRESVRFAECVALLAWPDGRRLLIGADAVSVTVEPTLYAGAAAIPSAIDAAVPAHLRIEMPAREPWAIPRPDPKRHRGTAGPRAGSRLRVWKDAGVTRLALLLALSAAVTALLLPNAVADSGNWVVALVALVVSGVLARALIRRIRLVRRLLQ